jgi:hypothetical protein
MFSFSEEMEDVMNMDDNLHDSIYFRDRITEIRETEGSSLEHRSILEERNLL